MGPNGVITVNGNTELFPLEEEWVMTLMAEVKITEDALSTQATSSKQDSIKHTMSTTVPSKQPGSAPK